MVFFSSASDERHVKQSLGCKAVSLGQARRLRLFHKTARCVNTTDLSAKCSNAPLTHSAGATIDQALSWTVLLGFLLVILLQAPGLEYFLISRDHGYQLCIATQILLGKVPGIDVITAYGPMAMYTSALGLKLSDSLIGETILCASGYSLCLFLIYWLVKNHSSIVIGLVAAGAGFLVQARFYKWYVWLIPLGSLWVLHRYVMSPAPRRWRWVVGSGLAVGLSWLFRLDMGTLEFAACLIFFALIESGCQTRKLAGSLRILGLFTASFAILPLCWFVYLVIAAGIHAPFVFLRTTIEGALTVSQGMAQPLPPILGLVLAYILVPSTLLLAVGIGISREWVECANTRSRFLLAAALLGLSVFHQAMHRMGPSHLLQVIPPFIVCAFLLQSMFLHRIAVETPHEFRRLTFAALGLVYFLLLGYAGAWLVQWGRQDLISLSSWSGRRYFDLAHPLGAADRFPVVKAMSVIREQTDPSEPILVFPLDCQYYALAHRKLSGRHYAYYAGVFDAPRYRFETLQSIRKEMPALVVLPSDHKRPTNEGLSDDLASRSRLAHRYLEDFIREHYPRIVYDDGEVLLLARGS